MTPLTARTLLTVLLISAAAAVSPARGEPAGGDAQAADSADQENPKSDLEKILRPLLEGHRGVVTAAVKHLGTGESFTHEADRPMPTASLIKLPLMVAAYEAIDRGETALDHKITLREEDKVPGSGVLTPHIGAGAEITLADAIQLMIAFSDNTATNLVIDQVGLGATTELMEGLGLHNTKLNAKVFRRDTSINPEGSRAYGLGSTTAAEILSLVEMLHARELVSPAASDAMLERLFACQDRGKLCRYLPEETRVAHKGGSVSASRCDAGLMETPAGPIALAIFTTDNEDRSWGDENEAELLAGEFGRVVYQHFNNPDDKPVAITARVLSIGADGLLVESLQRTLNASMDPSPLIGVDGDFGPNTEKAVKRFQAENGLESDGRVDAATWRALGPLLTEDDPAPAPEVVNSTVEERKPADPLDGPPLVTCAAYAIADADTGEFLWGKDENVVRDPASITKLMPALLVVAYAEENPAVLDEVVTYSKRADETSGSTSAVRAGEQLSLRETLYGLMLPSGNDASVAIAEHLGDRLAPEGFDPEAPAYDKFVAAMNAKAAELGMKDTGYKNTHGLTDDGHVTTAADMLLIAKEAWSYPLMRKVVGTRVHGCTLSSVDGYQRNVIWKNSNRLLGFEGFDGLKTGTTTPAGACLVSTGERDGRRLFVVTLGSASTASRYVDSRNLYRWAWSQLGASSQQGAE
ncbi:D-alanyl-D-alanine carboxypeptidase DacB precursor [Pseudobythopirellula maris]|uniref:beta-lactamase n=1 Tax=Pseudobythopirellula maris TaxID=2527991 RepID=A0A5C5ZJ80_9BACT|nr:serine hydrolase [Pseudobythopirellula maris]TWT87238.1 D-alanyl-D-alanine carboxypeptidase DacB precursor [Pseudobythopirellula maris]